MSIHLKKDFQRLRHEMVEKAIVGRGVRSGLVLKAMRDEFRKMLLSFS